PARPARRKAVVGLHLRLSREARGTLPRVSSPYGLAPESVAAPLLRVDPFGFDALLADGVGDGLLVGDFVHREPDLLDRHRFLVCGHSVFVQCDLAFVLTDVAGYGAG